MRRARSSPPAEERSAEQRPREQRQESVSSFFGRPAPRNPPPPPEPALSAHDSALIEQVCTKTGLVWVRPGGDDRFHAAWHVWHEGAVHLVLGIGEQNLPPLHGVVEVAAASKDTGSRVITFAALAEVVPARSPAWEAAAAALSAKRLNALDPRTQHERWASVGLLARLSPLHVINAGAGGIDEPSGAQTPAQTPATTLGRRPWHLGGRT